MTLSVMRTVLRSPFVAALIGGAVVAAVMLVLGAGRDTVTKTLPVQQSAVGVQNASERSGGLTPHQIYQRTAPGVVYIRSQVVQNVQSPFDVFPQQQKSESTGSGFVIDENGRIITNGHVIDGASQITVRFKDDQVKEAKVVGTDPSNDLALLKVDTKGVKLDPLPLGDSSKVQVGDPTLAIGNPFGLDRTLTTGVISALQRRISAPNKFSIDHVIQTDAAINPGNSGGPLLDGAGRVIGINSQIATGGSGNGNVGIAFAVPINTAKADLPDLEKSGRVRRGYLGISGATVDSSFSRLVNADRGVLVESVVRGGPADKAGIKGGDTQSAVGGQAVALGGDVIQRIGGRPVNSMDDLIAAVSGRKPGERVEVEALRAGRSRTSSVTLAAQPDRAPSQ